MPAIIWIHGGGWRSGNKSTNKIKLLAEHGFFGVSIDYRLSGEASFPAAVEDSKCAVRWLRAHAQEYNINPDRVGVWGGSAGGHLSLMVATADGFESDNGWPAYSSKVQAACSYWGPSDLVAIGVAFDRGLIQNSAAIEFIGGTYSEMSQVYWLASPLYHVSADDPPLLLVHGELDPVVPHSQSVVIYEAYRDTDLEVTLVTVSGAGHGLKQMTDSLISPSTAEVEQMVLDFFFRELVYGNESLN
jgi:acetyl esterase/lipase